MAEKKSKIYISLPITGRDYDEVTAQANAMQEKIERVGCTAVNPLVINDKDASYEVAMGKCIQELLKCDYIMFAPGWWKSKGCQLEHKAATLFRIKTIQYKK